MCTPDHVFKTNVGECIADDLCGKYLDTGNIKYPRQPYVDYLVYLNDEIDVYDFTEPDEHWGIVEGVVVCGTVGMSYT